LIGALREDLGAFSGYRAKTGNYEVWETNYDYKKVDGKYI
jgi:hypothetical protein